jgi:hypothetical protein
MQPASVDRAKGRQLADEATGKDAARRERAAEAARKWPSAQDRVASDRDEPRAGAEVLVSVARTMSPPEKTAARPGGAPSMPAPPLVHLAATAARATPSLGEASSRLAPEPMPRDARMAVSPVALAAESGAVNVADGVASARQPPIVPAIVAEARRAPSATTRGEAVSIRIGSVELRTEPARAPAPAPAARSAGVAAPRLSLDAYLRTRRGR